MKERPILFSGPMVRALLAGTKTQTRRTIKPHPLSTNPPEGAYFDAYDHGPGWCWWMPRSDNRQCNAHGWWICPYGVPGDRLWVRETFGFYRPFAGEATQHVLYRAEIDHLGQVATLLDGREVRATPRDPWRPSIHMPRWASRLTLEITDVRVQRLQEISEEDALAEGIECYGAAGCGLRDGSMYASARVAYSRLWDDINGFGAWDANPWVWALTFRRVTP